MKRWLLYLAVGLAAAVFQISPFRGTDVGKLLPMELVRVSYAEGEILIETDTGHRGEGDTVEQALGDLEATTPGKIFLQTADFLLVDPEAVDLVGEIAPHLRPGCGICKATKVERLDEAATFLESHEPAVTLMDWDAGKRVLQTLMGEGERMALVW